MAIFRHTVKGVTAGGELWVSTMHTQGANTLGDTQAAWQAFVQHVFTGAFQSLWTAGTKITGTVSDQLNPNTGRNGEQQSDELLLAGSANGSASSPRDCVVVSLRTNQATRSGRGRMYWPAPAGASLGTDGSLTPATTGALVTAFQTGLATLQGVALPIIFHRATVTGTGVSSVAISSQIGTQRRRTNKTPVRYDTQQF